MTLVGGTSQFQLQLNKIKRNKINSDVTLVWDDGKPVKAHKDNETDEEIAEKGAHAGFETEKEKSEQAVENPRNSEVADVKSS